MTEGKKMMQNDLPGVGPSGSERSRGEFELARRKLTRRTLWIAPALVVGLTLTRTAAATGLDPEPCEGRGCP